MRPTSVGMETHISLMLKHIDDIQPRIVVLDPISSFEAAGTQLDAHAMLVRVIDLLKARTITTLFTSLATGAEITDQVASSVSSLIDAWISLRNLEQAGERTRSLYVLKARGMRHSNQIREFLLTDRGADFQDVYVGPDGILVGSARAAQEMRDRASAAVSRRDVEQKKGELERKTRHSRRASPSSKRPMRRRLTTSRKQSCRRRGVCRACWRVAARWRPTGNARPRVDGDETRGLPEDEEKDGELTAGRKAVSPRPRPPCRRCGGL